MQILTYTATCLFGLEKFLGEEISDLGYERLETIDGRVTFKAPLDAVARANINLRFAERVFINLGSFDASTFERLFEGTKALPWEDFIGKADAFPVKGHSIKSALTSIPDCQSIVKKAIVERLKAKYGIGWFAETGVKYQVEFFILSDRASLMIDTSGAPLHKRGYRPTSNLAPLRETLAAALCKTARLREDVLLWDPMCGSGTIAIEGALMMTNTAPGISRSFASEEFPFVSGEIWRNARDEARSRIKLDTAFRVRASDIDPECVELTRANARRAGMSDFIDIFRRDALTISNDGVRGTVICNPPYGERLMSPQATEALYRNMGRSFAKLDPWQIYILTSHEGFERLYGRRADKIRKLYNGMIKCNLYQFFKPQTPKK